MYTGRIFGNNTSLNYCFFFFHRRRFSMDRTKDESWGSRIVIKPVNKCNLFPLYSVVSWYHTFLSDCKFTMKNQRKRYLESSKPFRAIIYRFEGVELNIAVTGQRYGVGDHKMTQRFCSRPNLQILKQALFPLILSKLKNSKSTVVF